MSEPADGQHSAAPSSAASAPAAAQQRSPSVSIWSRLREHKVAEWTLAYAASAYTLLHVTEMLSEAQDWPHGIVRYFSFVLLLGVPIVVTLAWYQGAKALRRVTGPELAILTTLLVIAGSVLWALGRTSGDRSVSAPAASSSGAQASASRRATPAPPPTAIAVMPFVNLTGDASKDYLGDGMAEELINTLTKVPGLEVPARTSSFAYKGRSTDIRAIALELGVGTVLEGSVRTAGNRIRIAAQLINARSGLNLWAQTYDRKFTDLFSLQDELATAIAQTLRVKLNGASPASVAQPPPARDVEAYDLYLQGFSLMLRGSQESLRLAFDLFNRALARDPTFARAFAARSRARLTFLARGYPLANAREDARRDAERALALDPSLGVAHQALANVSALQADWPQAEMSYRAALAADGNDPDIRSGYAMVVLAPAGRLHQARDEGVRSYLLAPASPNHVAIAALLSLLAGRDADALRFADLAIQLGASVSFGHLPLVYEHQAIAHGQYAQAAERSIAALSPELREAGGAEATRLVYAALSDPTRRSAARQALVALGHRLGAARLAPTDRSDLIVQFVMIDALDQAYEMAAQYLDEFLRTGNGGGAAWTFLWIPEMRPFRRDPRFQAFVGRLRLFEYWRRYGPPDGCALAGPALSCG